MTKYVVVADNYRQFVNWCHEQHVDPRREAYAVYDRDGVKTIQSLARPGRDEWAPQLVVIGDIPFEVFQVLQVRGYLVVTQSAREG